MNKYKIAFILFLCLLLLPGYGNATKVLDENGLTSIAVNGSNIAWSSKSKIFLSTAHTFPEYTTVDLDSRYGSHILEWSGDGKVLYALRQGILLRYHYMDGELTLDSTFRKPGLSGMFLKSNGIGDRLLVAIDGERTEKFIPGWRSGAELLYSQKSFEILPVFMEQSEGNILSRFFKDDFDKIYYTATLPLKSGNNCHYKLKDGNSVTDFFDCGSFRVEDIALNGKRLLLSGHTKEFKDKSGKPLITLFVGEVADGQVGEPNPVILPHADPIAWHAQFGSDENTILWNNLVRGEDGNEIIRREISMSTFADGQWLKPEIIFEVPNIQIWKLAVSHSLVAMINVKNQVILFEKSSGETKPKILDVELD